MGHMTTTSPQPPPQGRPARLALVGDRSASVRSHQRVPVLLAALRERHGLSVEPYWIPTEDAELPGAVDGFDAVWLLPGSPYRSEAGALAAVRTARTLGIPFLGTCGGFQHALLEYARDVCGLTAARHAENDPRENDPRENDPREDDRRDNDPRENGLHAAEYGDDVLIAPLACSLVGHEGRLRTLPGSLAERLLGSRESVERFHCGYGPVPGLLPGLEAAGLRFTGHDTEGAARVAELPGHPFYLATLFQPELSGDGSDPHPYVRGLAEAALARAAGDQPAAGSAAFGGAAGSSGSADRSADSTGSAAIGSVRGAVTRT
jgi:CTP synthase (UTP-ammonia lyase)